MEKGGKVLAAVHQETGLRKLVHYIKVTEQASLRTVVLIAHNGFSFDFPVLLNSLQGHSLMAKFSKKFAEVKLLFLDSLKLISEEVRNTKHGILSLCLSKSLGVVYEYLFNEKFEAHDAVEDTDTLSRILIKTELHQNKVGTDGLTLHDMMDRMNQTERISAMKSTFSRMPISE